MFATTRMFAEAYPTAFLSELKLENLLLINNYELSLMACLSHVQKLDLSGSLLDDDHDLWSIIPDLDCLRVLSLANINITDRGLKRVLLPCFDGRKLRRLAYLDIAGTGFTGKLLASLKRVVQLQQVLFYREETSLPLERIRDALSPWFRLTGRPLVERISTRGFGAGLLDRWSSVLAEAARLRRNTALPPPPTFYGLKQAVTAEDCTRSNHGRPLASSSNKVMFCRTAKRSWEASGQGGLLSEKRSKADTAVMIEKVENDILNIYR